MFGRLSPTQRSLVREVVRGQKVHDLGCGSLNLSLELVAMGAKKVVAIDLFQHQIELPPEVEFQECSFEKYKGDIDVAFVSWPWSNQRHGNDPLVDLIRKARVVVYLGQCWGGTMCGSSSFFQNLVERELLAFHPMQTNTLVIVGDNLATPRAPTGEEAAGMDDSRVFSFEETAEKTWKS